MSELKPCPFCGGDVGYNYNIDLEPDGITCKNCYYILRFLHIKHKPKNVYGVVMEEMATAWNRRMED